MISLGAVRCCKSLEESHQGEAAFPECPVAGWTLEAERLVGESILEGTAKDREKSVTSELAILQALCGALLPVVP